MNKMYNPVQILPIPYMKQKLENIYDINIYGNLYLIYKNLFNENINTVSSYVIDTILNDCNILVDDAHPIYLYLPVYVDDFTKDLILSFKSLFSNNVYIILGGYQEDNPKLTQLDCIANSYIKFPQLKGNITSCFLIDNSKSFEIFTSLSDTQRINIDPPSSCTISGPTLNYHIKQGNPNNVTHISFVNLLNVNITDNFMNFYLKGLTNKNNNFNLNF